MDDLRQISQTLWGQVKVRKPDFNLNPFEQEYFDKPHSAVLEANELGRNIRTAALTLGLMDELNKPATLFGQPLGYSVGDQIDMRLTGEYYGEINKPYYQKVPEYVDQTFRESVKRINNAFNPDVDSTPVERGVDVGLGLVKTALNTVMTPMNVVTPASQDIGRKVAEVTGSEGTGEMLGEVLPFLVMPNPLAFFAASKGSEYATNKIMDYLESTNVSDANKERFGEAIGLTTFIATHRLLTKGVKYSREKIKGLLKKEIDTKVAEIPRTLVIEAVKEKQKEVDLSKRGEENIKQQLKNLRLDKVERTGLLKQLEEQKAKTIELQKSLDEVVKTEGIKPEEYKETLNFKLKNARTKPIEGLTQEKLPLDLVEKQKTEIKEPIKTETPKVEAVKEKVETPTEKPKTGIEERTNKNGKKYYYDNDKKVPTSKKKFEEQQKKEQPVIEPKVEQPKIETPIEKPETPVEKVKEEKVESISNQKVDVDREAVSPETTSPIAIQNIEKLPFKEKEKILKPEKDKLTELRNKGRDKWDNLKIGDTIEYNNFGKSDSGKITKVNKNREGGVSSVVVDGVSYKLNKEHYLPFGDLPDNIKSGYPLPATLGHIEHSKSVFEVLSPEERGILTNFADYVKTGREKPPQPLKEEVKIEMPEEVATEFLNEIDSMIGQIKSASRESQGTSFTRENVGKGYEVTKATSGFTYSDFPEWFSRLGKSREEILNALEKIKSGETEGKLVSQLREIATEHLTEGQEIATNLFSKGEKKKQVQGQVPPNEKVSMFGKQVGFENLAKAKFPETAIKSQRDKGTTGSPLFEQKSEVRGQTDIFDEIFASKRKEVRDALNNVPSLLGSGDVFIKSVQLGAMHFKNGLVKFSEWSREMIKDLGDKVKPQLFKIWNEIRKFSADLGKIALDKIGEFVESRYNPARPLKMTQDQFLKFTGKEATPDKPKTVPNQPKSVNGVLNKFRGLIEGNASEWDFSNAIKKETFRNPKDQARYKELKDKLIKEGQGGEKLTRDEIIELDNLKPAMELALNKINAVRGKPQVASQNPITQASYQVLFEKMRTAEQEGIALNKKFDDLITKARNSRGRFRLWKDDKPVLDVLSGKKDKSTLTPEEQILVDELLKFQKEAKPIMTDKNVLRNYDFPLLRRGFFEAWKYDGLADALKEKWNQKNPREVNSILAEWSRTTSGEVFNPFALKRVGRTIPTMDLKKRLGAYTDIYTTKKHLDPILPTINRMIRALDKEGLKNNAKWIKDYADEILGKEFDEGWSEGNKKILSGLMTYNRLRYLWWNTAGAGVNWLAGKYQALMSPDMPIKDFLLGEARFFTPSGQKLLIDKGIIDAGHLESLNTYRGAAKELLSPYILYALGERHIQGALYLGKLTKEEFRSGKISPQRDREILEIKGASQGFYHKGLRPDMVRTTLGRGAAQFRLWMPAVIESKLTKIQSTYNVAKSLLSKEKLTPEDTKQVKSLGKELSLVGSALLLYNSEVLDDDFKEQLGDLLEDFYSYGDPRSIAYTAKNIFPIASTVADLSTLLYNAVTQAKYKTNAKYGKEGELRAIGDVKKLLPAKRFLNQMGITDPDEQVKEGTFKLPEYKSQFQGQQYKSPFGD